MRIIAGNHKGKKLKEFKGQEVRPTSDRAKEALFSILSTTVLNSCFLDLCCGTGSVGLEAYSRGAKEVVFVDKSPKSIELAKQNAQSIGLNNEFVISDAVNYILKTNKKFDLIFFDPPYAFSEIEIVLNAVKKCKILKDGLFIYERDCKNQPKQVSGFEIVDSRKYGVAVFDFYKETL